MVSLEMDRITRASWKTNPLGRARARFAAPPLRQAMCGMNPGRADRNDIAGHFECVKVLIMWIPKIVIVIYIARS
jgi:hypothetical protein